MNENGFLLLINLEGRLLHLFEVYICHFCIISSTFWLSACWKEGN